MNNSRVGIAALPFKVLTLPFNCCSATTIIGILKAAEGKN